MSKKNNIIEINGRKYDAQTGQLLHAVHEDTSEKQPTSPKTTVVSKKIVSKTHTVAAHTTAHKPQTTQTLMRHIVKKPGTTTRKVGHPSSLNSQLTAHKTIETKLTVASVDSHRLLRARHIKKSPLIVRFPDQESNFVPSQQPPATQPSTKQAVLGAVAPPVKPNYLQIALDHADSHTQPAYVPKRTGHRAKTTRIVAVSSAVFVLALAFAVVVNTRQGALQFRSVSHQAGFAAVVPAYKPTGFSQSGVSSAGGSVTVLYHSNGDVSQTYSLSEQPSNWTDAELVSQYVTSKNTTYQTVSVGDHNAYLFGNGSITWLHNGVWYQVVSDGHLSNQQLIHLAASI